MYIHGSQVKLGPLIYNTETKTKSIFLLELCVVYEESRYIAELHTLFIVLFKTSEIITSTKQKGFELCGSLGMWMFFPNKQPSLLVLPHPQIQTNADLKLNSHQWLADSLDAEPTGSEGVSGA